MRAKDTGNSPEAVAGYAEIHRATALIEFPFESAVGQLVGFFKTFAARRIAGLLAHTGHVLLEPARRAATTGILYNEVLYHGFGHPRAELALELTRGAHRGYGIRDDDYLYTLGTFFVESMRLIDRYGRRPLSEGEREAMFRFNLEYGRRLGIPVDRFSGLPEYLEWYCGYEERYLHDTPAVRQVFGANVEALRNRVPAPLRPAMLGFLTELFDERLRAALELPRPGVVIRCLVPAVFGANALAGRLLPARREPAFKPGFSRRAVFPDGYLLDPRLGVVKALPRTSR